MMKRKILFSALSVAVSLTAVAQQVEHVLDRETDVNAIKNDPIFNKSLPENQLSASEMKKLADYKNYVKEVNARNQKAGYVEGIVDFGAEVDSFIASGVFVEAAALGESFPDSTVQIHFSNADRFVHFHGFGGVYDPQTPVAYPWTFDRNKDTVHVDTIYWTGGYRRYRTIADDTFHIEIVKGDLLNSDPSFGRVQYAANTFPNQTQIARGTSPAYAGTSADGFHLGLDGVNVLHEKIVLTDGDDEQFLWKLPVNITLNPNEGLGVFISLELGTGSYTAGETIDLVAETGPNFFRQVYWHNIDENDDNSYFVVPHAYEDIHTDHGTTRTCGGSWLNNITRYAAHVGTDAWRNDLVNFYGGALSNDIGYYVRGTSTSPVGIQRAAGNDFNLEQNAPNPFNNVTTVRYNVTNSTNVRFEVYDITGKTVQTINEGRKVAGSYSLEISAHNLDAGVYYYTLFSDAGKQTRKMIVVK